jgi:hypothetical protein
MPEDMPPIRVEALMRLAWGLTLNLSGDETQQKTGEMINERFGKLWESRKLINKDKRYLNEIITYLSSFLRNMGYEKDFLVQELDINENIREEEIKSINDLADLTSISNEGLVARIVAFLFGGASIFPLIERLFGLNKDNTSSLEIVEKSSETVRKMGDTTTTDSTVSKIASDAPQELAVPDEILIFLVGGGIGIFVLTLVIKLVKGWWIKNKILKNTIQDQQSHWETHVREEFERLMKDLFKDIKESTNRYYPNYDESVLGYNDAQVDNFIYSLLPKKDLYVHG